PCPDGLVPDGMYISAGSPTRSLRTAGKDGREWLIVAGEEFKPGEPEQEQKTLEDLKNWLTSTLGTSEITHLWTNEDFRSMDGAAFIGPASSAQPNLLVATGFEAWGITQGMVAAEIIAARIQGREHPAESLYDSTRLKLVAGGATFASENLAAAVHLVGDRR